MTNSTLSPVTRETCAFVRDRGLRSVYVTITGPLLELRAKGLKTRETVDVASIYFMAVRQRIAKERAEKKVAKKLVKQLRK